jgi:hypothetical protein
MTVELAFELALKRYDQASPDLLLIVAVANCRLERARQRAHSWIEFHRETFLGDGELLLSLIASPYSDTRQYVSRQLQLAFFDEEKAKALIGRIMTYLLQLPAEENEKAGDIAEVMLNVFGRFLKKIGDRPIRDLLSRPLPALQRLAGELVLQHDIYSKQPPEDLLTALIQSEHQLVREIGVRILGQLPDQVLLESVEALFAMTCHELADVRDTIRPAVKRLADVDPTFAHDMCARLIDSLFISGAPKGVPSHVARILREDLRSHLDFVAAADVWKLLRSRSPVAQDVGGMLLTTNVNTEDLTVKEIARLSNHDILSVREAAWQMCKSRPERIRREIEHAVRMLDSKWDDTRAFAMDFFRENVTGDDLSPTVLVSLCDSVRPEVQQFGRELITKHFQQKDGREYLLKLGEHPAAALQQFVTHYLEEYAAGDFENTRRLKPSFLSVLSRVNVGRIAKDRVLGFLRREALRDHQTAEYVAEIASRQSATCSIGDKGRLIQLMVELKTAYPDIDLPLEKKDVEVRGGV